jgi:hypothetical protein
MSLSTATLERFTTATAGLTPVTETPVTRHPTGPEAARSNSPFDTLLYVTRIDTGDEVHGDCLSTVVTVAASPSRDGWFRRNSDGHLQRVYGAPLNPEMVDGRYYRSLGHRDMLVRYNDEDHRGDRHNDGMPLSIIASGGAPWPFPSDSMGMWQDVPYIEVEAPALTPAPEVPAAELTDAHQFVEDTGTSGPTRGLAEADADGRVLLNPELEVGGMYLYWTAGREWTDGSIVEGRIVRDITDGAPAFSHVGYWTMERFNGELGPYFYTSRRTVLDPDDEYPKNWAKLALTTPEPTNTDTLVWSAMLSREAQLFSEFNAATNTLAEENEWCSEYEGIVEKLGMEGREEKTRDWDVAVDVDFSFTVDSVSGAIDRAVASDYSIPGISISSARFTGSTRVNITVSELRNEDAVRDYIDTNEVYEALSSMMSGADDIEVDDYTIYEIEEQ